VYRPFHKDANFLFFPVVLQDCITRHGHPPGILLQFHGYAQPKLKWYAYGVKGAAANPNCFGHCPPFGQNCFYCPVKSLYLTITLRVIC